MSLRNTVAVVNGHKITGAYVQERFNSLPEAHKSAYVNRKDELLEQLIVERRGSGPYPKAVRGGHVRCAR